MHEALTLAIMRNDGLIQWTNPDQAVIGMVQGPFLDFTHPALAKQLTRFIQELALAAAFVPHVSSHMIRAGGARNISHIHKQIGGIANTIVSKGLGHARSVLAAGTTDSYVGPMDSSLINIKAGLDYKDRYKPLYTKPFEMPRFQSGQIDLWCDTHQLDKTLVKDRKVARDALAREALDQWRKEAKGGPVYEQPSKETVKQLRMNVLRAQKTSLDKPVDEPPTMPKPKASLPSRKDLTQRINEAIIAAGLDPNKKAHRGLVARRLGKERAKEYAQNETVDGEGEQLYRSISNKEVTELCVSFGLDPTNQVDRNKAGHRARQIQEIEPKKGEKSQAFENSTGLLKRLRSLSPESRPSPKVSITIVPPLLVQMITNNLII